MEGGIRVRLEWDEDENGAESQVNGQRSTLPHNGATAASMKITGREGLRGDGGRAKPQHDVSGCWNQLLHARQRPDWDRNSLGCSLLGAMCKFQGRVHWLRSV